MLDFRYCGINFKKADQDVRDIFSFTDSKKEKMLSLLEKKGINQAMILSTCNRSEIFYFYNGASDENIVLENLKNVFQKRLNEASLSADILDLYIEKNSGRPAMEYLFKVATGLESMVLGEDQILSQVKDSYEFSKAMGYSKKELNRVVTDAIAAAKKIKTMYKISEIPLSVGYIGVKALNEKCPIAGKKVLIIGSGQTSRLALKYICEYKPSDIYICNRTIKKAKELLDDDINIEAMNIQIKNLEDRYELLSICDIVVSATSAPHLLIEEKKCKLRNEKTFLDLAVPRDIDAQMKNNPLCTIIDLNMIEDIVSKNKRDRYELSEKMSESLSKLVDETYSWLSLTAVDETIESLQNRCEEIVRDSFEYINRKLSLSEHEQMVIERTLKASLKRLLREPIIELKNVQTKEEQEVMKSTVERLFHI